MFRGASGQQQSQLYDLGKQKNLFQTTDLPTFQSAWSGAAPMAAPVQPQEEVKKKVESVTTELPVAGSLSGSQLPQEPVKPQPIQPQAAPEFLQSSLDVITPELIDNTEEFVVPKMNYQFGPMGFKFEESGMTGDWMVATAPNGQTMEFSLDPAFGIGADKEAAKLKDFISQNTTTEGLKAIESQYTAENKKFNNQKQIDEELAGINQTAESFKNETKSFFAEKASLDEEKKYFESIPANQVKDQAYLDRYAQYIAKNTELEKKQQELIKKEGELQSRSQQLNSAVGKYIQMESKQGEYMGAGINAFFEGVGAQTAGIINNVIDLTFSKYLLGADEEDIRKSIEGKVATGNAQEDAKTNAAIANTIRINETRSDVNQRMAEKTPIPLPKEGQSYADWYNSLTDDQRTDIVDKANDDIKKDLKINVLPAAREGARTVLGDDNTTVAYSRLLEEGFWGGALLGTAKSLPALIGGNNAMGWATRTANMYAQNTDAIYKEMEQNPNFKDISEEEKLKVIAPIGITSAALESLGFRNVIANKGLLNRVALAAIGKAGATTTAKTFGDLVKNEAKTMLSKGLLTLTGAGLAEAETGAAQQVSEYAFKELYNAIKGKEMFETPDFMSAAYIKDVAKAGAQEAIGGFVLGTLPAISAAYSKGGYEAMDDNLFKIFEKGANDENLHKALVIDIKTKVAEGKMTLKEGKEMLNNYRNSIGLFNSLPDNLNTNEKKSAMNLLKEKRDLEQQIAGKDESLTRRQRNRISEINTELETLSETAATRPISITLPTGTEIQVDSEKRDALNALMSEYNELNDEKEKLKQNYSPFGVNRATTQEEIDNEVEQNWKTTNQGKRQAEILNEIMNLATPVAETETETVQQTGILSTPDTTTVALEQLPLGERTNITFIQEDGTETPIMGNEQMLSDLYHQAMATPEAERTPAQLDAIDTVQVSLKTQLEQEAEQMQQQPRAERAKTKEKIFSNVMKSLASIMPGLKVTRHTDFEEMKAYAERIHGRAVSQRIVGTDGGMIIYDSSNKPVAILINDEVSDPTTFPHEVWHAIFAKAFGDNPALFKEFQDRTRQILIDNGYEDIVNQLDTFVETDEYQESDTQAEEWMVQLGGFLVSSGIDTKNLTKESKTLFEQLKDLLNDFAMRIAGQPIFLEDATPEDILDFMASISDRMSRGESIAEFFKNQEQKQTQGAGTRLSKQVSAYHGSPFEFDKFSTENIGKGEGRQAFGWGLYFTELRDIAKHYAKALTQNLPTFKGKTLNLLAIERGLGRNNIKARTLNLLNDALRSVDGAATKQDLINYVNENTIDIGKEREEALSLIEFYEPSKDKSTVYEVTLHEGKTPEQYTWLEWNKTTKRELFDKIAKQLEIDDTTRKQGERIGTFNEFSERWKDAESRYNTYKTYSNGEVYEALAKVFGPKDASLLLLRAGIDGVKYPAESISRSATDNTARGFNYVVFDENAVTVNQRTKPQKTGKTGFEERKVKEETNRAKVREYNQKAKEDRGKNISVKDFDTIKKRGQDLKVGDVYARRIGDAVYVFKVLSNLKKLNGQFYSMNVEVLDTGTDYARQELDPNFDIREVGKKVGDKSIDSFKNLASSSGGLNFGEVTVLQDYESKTAETTPTLKGQPKVKKSKASPEGAFLFRTEENANIGFQYDTDKVARERFNINRLEKIGAGSDRVVFDLGDGKVLKVAKTARGLEQNIYEGDAYNSVIPNVLERGLNYVVTEKADRLRADDMVPVYNEEGDQIGDARAAEMIKELQKFSQKDFNFHDSDLQEVLRKYNLQDIMNYDVLWGDFTAMRNWGYKDGMPLHIDGGTFGGVDMLASRPSKSLTDPEFKEIYDRSKKAKKEFGDTDAYVKFQKTGKTGYEEVTKIAQRYNVNTQGFAPKQVNDAAMRRELAPFGFSVKRARVDEQGRGGGVFIIDGNGRFYNPFSPKVKKMDISRGRFFEEEDNIANIPGYDRLITEIEGIIQRGKRRGAAPDRIMQGVMNYVMTSAVYERANDVQREQMVRNIQTEFGKRLKSAPSVGRLLGTIKDIKKITLTEKELLKQQIKSLARGARTSIAAWRAASRELVKEIDELRLSGKVTTKQVSSIIKRFANVNMFNEDSVDKFVEYMAKVFEDANYAEKIDRARRLLPTAKRNIRTKIGIAEAAGPLLQQMFAINPSLIPDAVLDKYLSLVEMFGEKATVLKLGEVTNVIATANEILDAVDEEVSLAEELAIRFDNYDDKVFDDNGKLDYAATLAQMQEQNVITEEDAKLMQKYKNLILPKVQKPEMTEAEIEQEKNVLISVINSLDVDDGRLPTRDERALAKELKALLKPEILKQLTIPQLKNVIKLIDNINNGYLPHYAELTVERLDSFKNSDILVPSIKTGLALKLEKAYSRFKNVFTRKGATVEMIRRNPLYYVDQLFGDFKSNNIYKAVFEGMSKAQALFESEMDKINKTLDKAHDDVAKSYGNDSNDTLFSSFKMMTYMLQLEYESNPNNKEVHPVSKVIQATIKHIDKGYSRYGDREVKMLEDILENYTTDGEIDSNKLYESFNPAEKKAIKTIQELNESLRDKAVYTAAVIRGDRINPLNNYVHHYVMHQYNPDENATGVQTADAYNNSIRPSTRAQSLIERTNKVSPMNFDVFASAQRGAKFVLLDYTMTKPIRTARKTLSQTEIKLEEQGRIPKEQREIFNAINNSFDEVVKSVLTNNFITDSFADEVVNAVSKAGYRAILASVPRFISELTSNLGTIIFDPKSFADGVKIFKGISNLDAENVMKNSKSVQTNRFYGGQALSGKFIDSSVLSQTAGIKSATAKGDVANVVNKIYNNSLKKYKNFVELTADALISTPDKLVMRPFWMGVYANTFKQETGQDIDLEKVAANDEAYMNEYKDAIEKATNTADRTSVRVGATDNPFMGMLKGTVKPNQSALTRGFNNFNNFMTRFAIYEYSTAREGIYAMMDNGMITRKQGAALLAGVAMRMTVYTLLSQMLGNGMLSLFADDDEDDEKSFMQKFSQSLASTGTGLILGRNFGNATKSVINYGVEEMNEEFLTGLREGDYDPYKDAISYSIVPKERKGHKTNLTDFITQMGGSFGPALKTADLITRKAFEAPKKEEAAIERGKQETQIRIPLEVLGHLGYVPLYKDIRKIVMDQMYKDLENADKKVKDKKQAEKEMLHGYENKTDMKRYNPELYEQVFGEKSPGYDAEQAKRKIEKEKEDLERRRKDEFYDYTPKKTQEKSGGFGSKEFGGGTKKQSGGFGSKKFGE
jgi:hypothetical protein